jgi:hypothetical protein
MIRTDGYRDKSLILGDELIALARAMHREIVIAILRRAAGPYGGTANASLGPIPLVRHTT